MGISAPEEFIDRLETMAAVHHERLQVDVIRAYYFGARFLVEMEVVRLPGDRATWLERQLLPALVALGIWSAHLRLATRYISPEGTSAMSAWLQVMPHNMSVKDSHDIALLLQHKVALPHTGFCILLCVT